MRYRYSLLLDILTSFHDNDIVYINYENENAYKALHAKLKRVMTENPPPEHVDDILFKDYSGTFYRFVCDITIGNKEFCSELKKRATKLDDDELDNDDNVLYFNDDTVDMLVEIVYNMEEWIKKGVEFVDNAVNYIISDLDLPFYSGKDFFRKVSDKEQKLLTWVFDDEKLMAQLPYSIDENESLIEELRDLHNYVEENYKCVDWEYDLYEILIKYIIGEKDKKAKEKEEKKEKEK